MELSNFGQALKGPDRVNWIKGVFEKYDKNSAFGLPYAPFTHANLTITTQVLRYILAPAIKNITDNIYLYFTCYCANGGPQVQGINFDQSSYPVLVEPKLHLIVAIMAT